MWCLVEEIAELAYIKLDFGIAGCDWICFIMFGQYQVQSLLHQLRKAESNMYFFRPYLIRHDEFMSFSSAL